MSSITKAVIEHWGIPVVEIPTSEHEESDFVADFEGCKVLIEEKQKFDDPATLKKREDELAAGNVHLASEPVTRSNRLSGLIRKAADQLNSSAKLDHNY